MTPTVREAETADVEAIRTVAEAAWYAAYGGFMDPATIDRGLRENYDTAILEAAIDHEDIALFVATVDSGEETGDVDGPGTVGSPDEAGADGTGGQVVGFASAERTWADEVELHTLYVHPDRWGEGAGSALLARVEAWARERDVDRIAAGVLADNAVGVEFFEAAGFRRGTEANAEVAGEFQPEYEYEYPL